MARIRQPSLPIEQLTPCRRRRTRLPVVPAGAVALIRRHGVFLPVVVRPLDGRYEILANLVSWLVAQRIGIDRVPVSVLNDLDDDAADAIIEAEADGPLIRAERYHEALVELGGAGRRGAVTEVARQFGVHRTSVAHMLRLRAQPAVIREALTVGALSAGHAKALAGTSDDDRQALLAVRAIQNQWSVRRLEREVLREPDAGESSTTARRSPDVERLERGLSETIGCPVRVREADGVLEIDYRGDLEVLTGVIERFGWSDP